MIRNRKLCFIKFIIVLTLLSVICALQYLTGDDREEFRMITFNKRHLLNFNQNSTELNKTNCIRPDIEQFPKGFSTHKQRVHGLVLFHFFIAFYMFIALSIVCDNYFVPALESICQGIYINTKRIRQEE
jgi:hypothetical protein